MIYKYYLFDLDGVLINTDNIQYNSTKEAIYNTCKYDISSKDDINIFKSTITTRKKLEYLVNRKVIKDNDVEKIYSLKKSIANEKFEKITIDKKNPTSDELRSLQMKPYSGTITEGLLKKLGY